MAIERIERLINKEAIADFDKLYATVIQNVSGFEKLIATGVELNNMLGKSNTFKAINEGTKALSDNEKDLVKQIANLTAAQEKMNRVIDQQAVKIAALQEKQNAANKDRTSSAAAVEKAQNKLNNSYSAEARTLAEIGEQQKLVNQANRQSAKETLGLVDAYARVEQQYKKAAREAQNAAIEFGENSEEAKEASRIALEFDKRLKSADAAVGRYNRNVGNYSGALKTLEKALDAARAKQDAYRKSGEANADVVAQMVKEEQLLEQLLDNQANGFASATAELKNNERALRDLAEAGFKNTAFYKELLKTTAELKDDVGDLKAEIKNLASDTSTLDGLIQGAQTLAGVYGIAQGAAALFGSENEELQKTLVKLQAVQSILAGLQALQNALQKESSFRLLITTGLQKINLVQINLANAAESRSIIVRYAAIAAQKALNAVMALAGGPFGIVIAALGALLLLLSSFSTATKKAALDFGKLTEELGGSLGMLDEGITNLKQAGEIRIAELQSQFASEKEIREERLKQLRGEVDLTKTYLKDYGSAYREAFAEVEALTQKGRSTKLDEEEKKRLDEASKFVDKYAKARQKLVETETQVETTILNNRQATTEENAKAQQEAIERERQNVNTRKTLLEQDAANTRLSFDDRIRAQQRANVLEQQLINEQARKEKLTPGLTPSEVKNIENARSNAEALARKAGDDKLDQLRREKIQREKDAQYEIARVGVEAQKTAADEIAANTEKSFEDRSFALYDSLQQQEALINGAALKELDNVELTATERKAIDARTNEEILAARRAFAKSIDALALEDLEKGNNNRVAQQVKDNADAIRGLDDAFNKGLISLQEYNRKRARLEVGYNQDVLDLQIANVQRYIDEYKKQGKDVAQLEAELAQYQMQQSELVTQKKIADLEKVKAAQVTLGEEIADLFKTIVFAQYDEEKNRIQGQIDAIDQRKEADIAAADQTIQDEAKKADAIAIINARAQADKEALERKQRQLDVQRAKFEKASNIAKIITDTARGVVAALTSTPPNVPLSIYVGAIGAVQLAKAIATPVPAYRLGGVHPADGIGLYGDGGVSEFAVAPDGTITKTPSIPTYAYMEKGTRIYRNEQAAMEAGVFNNLKGAPVLTDTGSHYKYMTDRLTGEIRNVTKAIKDTPRAVIKKNRNGWEIMNRRGGNQTTYLNGNLQG